MGGERTDVGEMSNLADVLRILFRRKDDIFYTTTSHYNHNKKNYFRLKMHKFWCLKLVQYIVLKH